MDMFTPAQWTAQWTDTISDSYSKDNAPFYLIEETSAQEARKLFNETLIHPPLLLSIRSTKVSVNAAQTEESKVQGIDYSTCGWSEHFRATIRYAYTTYKHNHSPIRGEIVVAYGTHNKQKQHRLLSLQASPFQEKPPPHTLPSWKHLRVA